LFFFSYKSFARNLDNIGDITAKGESQVAVIDLIGMFTGIILGKSLHASKSAMITAFVLLSVGDLLCVYFEIRSVVFNSLNFERLKLVLPTVFRMIDTSADQQDSSATSATGNAVNVNHLDMEKVVENYGQLLQKIRPSRIASLESLVFSVFPNEQNLVSWTKLKQLEENQTKNIGIVPLITNKLNNDSNRSTTDSLLCQVFKQIDDRVECHPTDLSHLESNIIGSDEDDEQNYLLVLHLSQDYRDLISETTQKLVGVPSAGYVLPNRFVVYPIALLHKRANHDDTFELMVMLNRFYYKLKRSAHLFENMSDVHSSEEKYKKTKSILDNLLQESKDYGLRYHDVIKRILENGGWDMQKFMFGSLPTRVEW
jgi:hypothetical protein